MVEHHGEKDAPPDAKAWEDIPDKFEKYFSDKPAGR
jgi:hypothetical protein